MNMLERKLAAKNARKAFFKRRGELRRAGEHAKPTVQGVLPGEPLGLIPKTLLTAPLKVEIPHWENFPVDPTRPGDKLRLQWRPQGSTDDAAYTDLLDPPVIDIRGDHPDPMIQEIPLVSFEYIHGAFEFRYLVEGGNDGGAAIPSETTPIVLDIIPPYGNEYPTNLDLTEGPITDANSNAVVATIPSYPDQADGDRIGVYWVKDKVPEEVSGWPPIGGFQAIPIDRKFPIPQSTIIDAGDGDFFACYVLLDKAGIDSRVGGSVKMPVALGPLPTDPFPALTVRHADEISDELIDRDDAFLGVYADIKTEITNWKIGDSLTVTWGDQTLDTPYPINQFPVNIPVPWTVLKAAYDFQTPGSQDTIVQYDYFRGSLLLGSANVMIKVDLSKVGPENPDEPNPVNPALGVVTVESYSSLIDKIETGDVNQPAKIHLKPYEGIDSDQEIEFFWGGKSIGTHTVTTEVPGGPDIEFTVNWADIEAAGNGDVDVWFTVSHPDFINEEKSKPKSVAVSAVPIVLPSPEFPTLDPAWNWLNCPSLELTDDTSYGVRVHIPVSKYLVEGAKIKLKWTSFIDRGTTTPIPGDPLESGELTVSKDQADNGFDWWIRPYETYFLPIYNADSDNAGSGKIEYTLLIQGNEEPGVATVEIGMYTSSGSCPIPPNP